MFLGLLILQMAALFSLWSPFISFWCLHKSVTATTFLLRQCFSPKCSHNVWKKCLELHILLAMQKRTLFSSALNQDNLCITRVDTQKEWEIKFSKGLKKKIITRKSCHLSLKSWEDFITHYLFEPLILNFLCQVKTTSPTEG